MNDDFCHCMGCSETILNYILAVLSRKNETIYILYQRIIECYYGNIAPVLVLIILSIYLMEK